MLKKSTRKLPKPPKKKLTKIVEIPKNEVEEIPKESQVISNENEQPKEEEKVENFSGNDELFEEGPPSSVPLADGTIPSEQQLIEEEELKQQQWLEEYEKKPDPTPAQFKAQIAANIAKESAEDAVERMKTDSYKTMKAQQKFKKTADQQLVDECAELARKLNAYRQKYNGIINYKFRKHYEVNLGYATLNSECKEVEIILNTQNLPNALKEIGYNVTQNY